MRTAGRCLLAIALLLLAAGEPALAATVRLVLSGEGDAYRQTALTIADRLATTRPDLYITRQMAGETGPDDCDDDEVLVAIGTRAAQVVAERARACQVHSLVTQQSYAALPAGERRSAVFIDQPVARQLALIQIGLPGWKQLAIVHGPRSAPFVATVSAQAQRTGMTLRSAEVTDNQTLFDALQSVLATPAVLLAVPEPEVFNNFTIQNVLLTAYRHRSPVVGFSPAYVRAGAVLAVHSSPEQMGRQTADQVLEWLRGGVPSPAFPVEFSVSVNPHVGRSLSIDLPDASTLEARLREREGAR